MGPIEPVNPYEPPKAELDAAPASGQLASLENAVAGRYDFQVGDVMSEAWRLVKGMKASFWGAAIVVGLIYLVFDALTGVVVGQVLHVPPEGAAGQAYKGILNMIVGGLLTPFTLGLEMMCVRRALGQPISFATAFSLLLEDRHHLGGRLHRPPAHVFGLRSADHSRHLSHRRVSDDDAAHRRSADLRLGPRSRRRARPSTTSGGASSA